MISFLGGVCDHHHVLLLVPPGFELKSGALNFSGVQCVSRQGVECRVVSGRSAVTAGDVTRCDYKSWHRVDGVISGPPCAMRRRSAEMA